MTAAKIQSKKKAAQAKNKKGQVKLKKRTAARQTPKHKVLNRVVGGKDKIETGVLGENYALSCFPNCPECSSRLTNANDTKWNQKGFDICCSNADCNVRIQVKAKRSALRIQSCSSAGTTRIMKECARDYHLQYAVIYYDAASGNVMNTVLSGRIKRSDIQASGSSGTCSVKFREAAVYDEYSSLMYKKQFDSKGKLATDSTTTWNIEKVLDERGSGKNREFLVKWQGFSRDNNSWVSELLDV